MDGIDIGNVAQEVFDKMKEYFNNLSTLNIIVAGKTGVGKSTLVNAVFRERLADTGIGSPVTEHIRRITKEGVPLAIYDTRGFELGKDVQNDVKREIMKTISDGIAQKDLSKAIHCLWYCINTASNRIEDEEIEWLRELTEENKTTQVPIIVVLTQSLSKKNAQQMRQKLLEENLDICQVIPVLAEDYDIEDVGIAKSFGLDELIQVMGQVLPDELAETLQNIQDASLKEKKRKAHSIVVTAAGTAAAIGAVPIPIADMAPLIANEASMLARITVIFGIEINKGIIAAILSVTLGAGGAALLGKGVVAGLLKLIPGAGAVVGGAINGSTAAAITAALGEAYIVIMEKVAAGEMKVEDLKTKEGKEMVSGLFKDYLSGKKMND